jgi:hypothetical protein
MPLCLSLFFIKNYVIRLTCEVFYSHVPDFRG